MELESITGQPGFFNNEDTNIKNSVFWKMFETQNGQTRGPVKADSEFFIELFERIRICLNAITGFSELLSQEQLTNEQQQYVHDINCLSENVVSVLDGAVELSRLQTGWSKVIAEKFSLERLFSEICAIILPQAQKKTLEFDIIRYSCLPEQICCDLRFLRKCLLNLASTVIELANTGYVHIQVGLDDSTDSSKIRFDFIQASEHTTAGEKNSIAESFCQLDDICKTLSDAGILRLAVTFQMAEALGGKITIGSDSRENSVFSLVIPTEIDSRIQTPPHENEPIEAVQAGTD